MIWTPSEVKNDSEDNKANDGQDLDGAGDTTGAGEPANRIVLDRTSTHAKTNSASPYAPVSLW